MASLGQNEFSLAGGGFDNSLKLVNFKLISMINIWSIFCEIAIRWMPQYLTDHSSTSVKVMAWCRQAISHYLNQCWPRSLLPNDVTRLQKYHQTSKIRCILAGNNIVDHSDVVGASPACRHCSNYIFILDLTPGFSIWPKTTARRDEKHLCFGIWCTLC